MLFLGENFKNIFEKDELINKNDDFEYESSILNNYKSPINELKIDNEIKILFPFNCQSIEPDEINEDNIYYISCFEKKRNNLKIIIDLNQSEILSQIDDNDRIKNKLLGRKRSNSEEKGFHCRDSFDNKLRKIKHVILQEVRIFINNKIKEVYKLPKKTKMELIKINPEQADKINIVYNRIFIHKTLKEIFSVNTTVKNICNRDFNKRLIEKLLKEKKVIFEDIFNLTFLEVSQYIIGKKPELIQLKGLNYPEKLKKQNPSDEEYISSLLDIIENFEERLNEKKPRNKKKKNLL